MPGLQMDLLHGSGMSLFLRGVGTTFCKSGRRILPVAIYVDGEYIPSPEGALFNLNNVERVEDLKGRRTLSSVATQPVVSFR